MNNSWWIVEWIVEFYEDFKFELWMLNIPNKTIFIEILQNPNHEKHKLVQNIIMNDSYYAYLYAKEIIKSPFPKGEKAIASDPGYAFLYASIILQNRFPLCEPTMKNDPVYKVAYEIRFKVTL